ncbi:MAG TPA: metal-dependent hydrolase [Pyrinomonadaceae bacterium]|jgi:inner membrane protein
MDNLTHSLVGLAAAKAGLERLSPYATALCVVAANGPDADLVMLVGGSWTYLEHHRGLSHAAVGTLALALLWPLLFYAGDFVVARLRGRPRRARLGALVLASLVVSASHPLMDWTNNYGVRPLLPWDSRWFYGDLVFIIDPWLWLMLGGAAFLLTAKKKWRLAAWALLATLATGAILFLPQQRDIPFPLAARLLWAAGVAALVFTYRARAAKRWGAGVAVVALAFVVVYWGALAALHRRALAQAQARASELAGARAERLLGVAAMPMLADPTRWRTVAETERAFLRFDVKLTEPEAPPLDLARFEKPQPEETALVARAAQDRRAEIFLDFARFPAVRLSRNCAEQTLVQFADLRFTEPGAPSRGTFSLEIPVGGGGEAINQKSGAEDGDKK